MSREWTIRSAREAAGAPGGPARAGTSLPGKLAAAGALAILFAFGLATVLEGTGRFLHAYLVSYAFFLSIALGALFFVALQHVTGAEWSVAVRRLAEIAAGTFPALALLFLPIAASVLAGDKLYPWAGDLAGRADAELIHAKAAWLSRPFFLARIAVYFVVWTLLARAFLAHSVEQDRTRAPRLSEKSARLAAPAILIFGVSITFAAFDLLMSLDPAWYSTIFGVYFFAGSVVGFFAAVILAALALDRAGVMRPALTVEHYHDLGKLLFAFVFFWGYIAFSQYMLIWYANLPEETSWFYHRVHGPWRPFALSLTVAHFGIPFMGLLSRSAKRTKGVLAFFAAWLLVMHWVDLYWIVMPGLSAGRAPLGLVELVVFGGLLGLTAAAAVRTAEKRCAGVLVPVGDPKLARSLAFENV